MYYDKIIIGAGIFGLYAAKKSLERGEKVLVLEYDDAPFKRASWINQARVHNGYHYPRSYATAHKSAEYFERFVAEHDYAILRDFTKIYATSAKYSYTNAQQFTRFCQAANIPLEPIRASKFFKPGICDGVFETLEYAFDATLIGKQMLAELNKSTNFTIQFATKIHQIDNHKLSTWIITTNKMVVETEYLINATYASLNQILTKAHLPPFDMKYELCEIILCKVSDKLQNVGITVMDGAFFSLMPFGKTEYHSLTAVSNTPHLSSNNILPKFDCQQSNVDCDEYQLANCNDCLYKPKTAFWHMYKLAKKYLTDDIEIYYQQSLFSMKAILKTSETDDSRPTIIKFSNTSPRFLSIFSGKINTIYDLDEVL
jgi:hypothetical protein